MRRGAAQNRKVNKMSIDIITIKYMGKKESLFDYDLIKDRRYTVDKFQLYVPITMTQLIYIKMKVMF